MPLKIWYNGSMHNMTTLKMVTFINGVKKRLVKGVTFVNGQKKILWQTGNFSINSWTLGQLGYPNQNALPVGMYCNLNRVLYSAGEYVARSNISNISAPALENCVKNGKVRTWLAPFYTSTNESFAGDVKSYTTYTISTPLGQKIRMTVELTTVNKLNINTNDLSISSTNSASDNKDNPYFTNGVYIYHDSYGWVSVKCQNRQYVISKGSATFVTVPATGYSTGTVKPYFPQVSLSGNLLFFTSVYQAAEGDVVSYGIKKVDLSSGTIADIEANLSKEVTSMMVDDGYLVYTYDNKLVKRNISNNSETTYTANDTPLVLVGKIGDYYYAGSSRSVPGENAKYLDIHIVSVEDMTLREKRNTDSKATIINGLPYVSNNEYLCFGTYHAVGQTVSAERNIQVSYRTLPSGTISDVQYKIVRIHGF